MFFVLTLHHKLTLECPVSKIKRFLIASFVVISNPKNCICNKSHWWLLKHKRSQMEADGGNITQAWERLMNTWTEWCLALRELTEVFASEGEWRHIYLWLSQSHYTRILTAWYPIHPSERWLHLLSTLSCRSVPDRSLLRNCFLIFDRFSVHQMSLEGRSAQPSLLHFITSPPSLLLFESSSEWWLAVTLH